MATLITKNSSTTTSVPIPSQLVQGELAVNVTDKRLFTEDSGGSVVEVGTNPSSLTLSSGTANGVTYLNGSKVLTSGTALVFDGTNLGVGTTSPATKLDIQGSVPFARVKESSTGYLGFRAENNSGNFYFGVDSSTGGFYGSAYARVLYSDGAYPMVFYTNATERMRLDSSGNLGIGTTSPTQKLEVNGAALVNGTSGFARVAITGTPASGTAALQISINSVNARTLRMENTISGGHTYDIINGGTSAGNLAIYDDTVGAYRLIIDGSGNLGLGVTPSAWDSIIKPLEFFGSAYIGGQTSGVPTLYAGANAFYSGGSWKYKTTNPATNYYSTNGQHQWYTAPSGTAGNAITFTQAMTLDASGNLGVGTTSISQSLQIDKTAASIYINSTGQGTSSLFFAGTSGSASLTQFGGELRFNTGGTANTAGTGVTEKMRLDSAGNLGLGVTPSAWSSSYKFMQFTDSTSAFIGGSGYAATVGVNSYINGSSNWVRGGASYAVSQLHQFNGSFIFNQAAAGAAGSTITFTQAMTLDASGNLLVGTTSLNGGIAGLTNNLSIMTTRNTGATAGKFWKAPYVDTSNRLYIINQDNTGVYIADGATAWTANSDERLKTTLVPFENAAAKICTLRAGTGRYLTDEDTVSRSFLIAQDVQKVLPEAVNVQADEMGTLGLSYTDLIPLLTAAIQEQQAMIEELKTRLAAAGI